jgi:murein DD-endopeptidase MepM/ murein hydrolase activator NlpD
VTLAGRNGGAGNMVSIRHPNGYETNYLHLSRFAKGIQRGARVGQGQVIGYVGSTGLSTGPHLDYRVTLNGRWINPLSISSPPAEPLAQVRLQRYLAHALAVLSLLEGGEPPVGARC